MKAAPAKPTTIELPMKPRDRAEACPEVTRCQLEVIWDDGQGAMFIKDGPNESKLVQVGLIGEKGCDAKVRVGMIEAYGPLAVGASPRTVELDVVYNSWERQLNWCIDPEEKFLGNIPRHLLNVRYATDTEYVSLIVVQDLVSSNWQVIVDRRGLVVHEALRLNFSDSNDGLVVAAALSNDLSHLYVVEARQSSGFYSWPKYSNYFFDQYSGQWVLLYSATAPAPDGAASGSRAYTVNRDGMVLGYFAPGAYTTRSESEGDTLLCNAPSGSNSSSVNYDFTNVSFGWSIPDREWETKIHRYSLGVLQDRDISPVVETCSGHSLTHQADAFSWSNNWPTPFSGIWQRAGSETREGNFSFSVSLPGMSFTTKDSGSYRNIAGHTYQTSEVDNTVYPAISYNATVYSLTAWNVSDGHVSLSVTAGGWVSVETDETDVILSGRDTTVEWIGYNANWGWGNGVCTALSQIYAQFFQEQRVTQNRRIVYPVNLGEYYSVHRSFTAMDQVSGDSYFGAMVQAVQDGPLQWHVYRNGMSIADALPSCLGRPLEQLCAIFWRA